MLFDIDGTLIDSGGAGTKSWAFAFDRLYGHPVDIGAFTDAGMTDPVVAARTFERDQGHSPSPRELARLIHAYLSVLPDFVQQSEGYRVLDGVKELLPRLAERGVLLGITTGAVEAAAHVKLGRGGLNHWFAFGGYGSDSADRVELTTRAVHRGEQLVHHRLDRARVFVVGDTPLDIAAAKGAGLVSVGVASHHHTKEQLAAAGPDHLIGTLAEPFPGLD